MTTFRKRLVAFGTEGKTSYSRGNYCWYYPLLSLVQRSFWTAQRFDWESQLKASYSPCYQVNHCGLRAPGLCYC